MPRPLQILGVHEVADLLDCHRVTVHKWLTAGKMPAPDQQLAAGPVWRESTIRRWAESTGRLPERSPAF